MSQLEKDQAEYQRRIERIKRAMGAGQITPEKLSASTNIPLDELQAMLAVFTRITWSTAVALAAGLGVSVSWLLYGLSHMAAPKNNNNPAFRLACAANFLPYLRQLNDCDVYSALAYLDEFYQWAARDEEPAPAPAISKLHIAVAFEPYSKAFEEASEITHTGDILGYLNDFHCWVMNLPRGETPIWGSGD